MPRVSIDVMLKDEILDPEGQAIERALPELGFAGAADVRVGKHIELDLPDGDDLEERIEAMASDLLANPVIESYTYRVHR